ncbi:hypothetical protein N2152v2_009253 [Parachlorella kessleri]
MEEPLPLSTGEGSERSTSIVVDLASGTAAGDTLKVKLQTAAPGQAGGALAAARSILRAQGPLGLYKGMGAPLATVAAFNAVLFSTWGALERILGHADGSPLTTSEQCLAGAIAGIPVSLMATPTELLKCRLQAQAGKQPPPGKVYTLAEIQAGEALFKGPLGVMGNVLRHEGGVLGLFRGLMPTLLREVPGNAAYFGLYDLSKRQLAEWQGLESTASLGPGALMTAGGLAGAAFWACCYPADVIKSKIQTDNYLKPQGVVDCSRQLWAASGWRGLWVGFGPCFARSIPANSAAFLTFEVVRAALS